MIWLVASLPVFVALSYWWWLARHAAPRWRPAPAEWPAIDVLVPTYDEARLLPGKLANLGALDYPHDRLRVWIVDGGSRDDTLAIARRFDTLPCEVIELPNRGKAAQLSAGLREGRAPLVLVTDADATLPPDALRVMASELAARPEVGAVGTAVTPAAAHAVERAHWAIQNRLREAEGRAGHAGLVMAPCYLFRRALVDGWPPDVVADDAFVTWQVARRGAVVGHVPVEVTEWRAPVTVGSLLRHKLRKTYAYTRELARAMPLRHAMPRRARAVLLWRVALSVTLPMLALGVAAALLGQAVQMMGVMAAVGGLGLAVAGATRHRPVVHLAWLPLVALVLAAASVGALALAIARRPPDAYRRVPDGATADTRFPA